MVETTADDVLTAIITLDAQVSRCFLAAEKLVRRDLPKAKRLVALGLQASEQSSAKRKIWNEMHAGASVKRHADAERAKLDAFAERVMAGLARYDMRTAAGEAPTHSHIHDPKDGYGLEIHRVSAARK